MSISEMLTQNKLLCVPTKMLAFLLVEALIHLVLILKVDADFPQK